MFVRRNKVYLNLNLNLMHVQVFFQSDEKCLLYACSAVQSVPPVSEGKCLDQQPGIKVGTMPGSSGLLMQVEICL